MGWLDGKRALVIFEGWSGAGKKATLKRLVASWDPCHIATRCVGAQGDRRRGVGQVADLRVSVLIPTRDPALRFAEDPPPKFFRLAPGREVRLRAAYFVTCTEVIKDASGRVVELRCTYDPATRGGDAPDGRRPKATLHWVSVAHAAPARALRDGRRGPRWPDLPARPVRSLYNIVTPGFVTAHFRAVVSALLMLSGLGLLARAM